MNYALLDDGRKVVVDSARNQTRTVTISTDKCFTTGEFFLAPAYVSVLLDGGWQAVKRSRLKPAEYGSPFMLLKT